MIATAAILALFYVFLTVLIILSRTKNKIATGLGTSNPIDLRQKVRAHANFIEFSVLFLILLFLAEEQGMNEFLSLSIGLLFILGRASHAFGLIVQEKYEGDKLLNKPLFRQIGMITTLSLYIGLSLYLLVSLV